MDKTFLIRWFGPFFDREDERNWEREQKEKFNLYMICGQKKYAKSMEHYYIGQTIRDVYKRFSDRNHHINDLQRINEIWIGTFANKKPTKTDINLAEKMLISCMDVEIGEVAMLNATNKDLPSENVYLISEWYQRSRNIWIKKSRTSPASIIPDVIAYRINDNNEPILYAANKLKKVL